jgi:hypothetical protein
MIRKGKVLMKSSIANYLSYTNQIFEECLKSLYFDNTRYSKIAEEYQHTLNWIWKHPSYIKWSEPDTSQLLYIEGKPGSWESTLAKYFRKNFRLPTDTSIVCRFFYSEREGSLQTSHLSMLRCILSEILNHSDSFFEHFQALYRRRQELLS